MCDNCSCTTFDHESLCLVQYSNSVLCPTKTLWLNPQATAIIAHVCYLNAHYRHSLRMKWCLFVVIEMCVNIIH